MIPAPARAKLKKLSLLLSSSQAGEVIAARNAITTLLHRHKLDWHDLAELIAPEAQEQPQAPSAAGGRPWQDVAQDCLDSHLHWTAKEKKFLTDMAAWFSQPSKKQLDWLANLRQRINRQWTDI